MSSTIWTTKRLIFIVNKWMLIKILFFVILLFASWAFIRLLTNVCFHVLHQIIFIAWPEATIITLASISLYSQVLYKLTLWRGQLIVPASPAPSVRNQTHDHSSTPVAITLLETHYLIGNKTCRYSTRQSR